MFGYSDFGPNPISFSQYHLPDELLAYIQEEALFKVENDDAHLTAAGFCRSVDYPQVPGHVYYEAYFHGLTQSNPVHTIHPRFASLHDKAQGPIRLVAFVETLRKVNADWAQHLRYQLSQIPGIVSSTLAKVINEQRYFAGKIFCCVPKMSY